MEETKWTGCSVAGGSGAGVLVSLAFLLTRRCRSDAVLWFSV